MSGESITVHDWVAKAEMDYKSALDLTRRRKDPLPDKVTYDCAQCAEKYLKAFLIRRGKTFRYRHDLLELRELCEKVDADFRLIVNQLQILNPWASEIRYPGTSATLEESRESVQAMKQMRKFVRAKLGLR
jgi:HEPN domain-containing protein